MRGFSGKTRWNPWTMEQILTCGRRFIEKHGRPPMTIEWREARSGRRPRPSASTVRRVFGSWAEFIEELGYRSHHRAWTKREIADAFLRWEAEHGRMPTAPEWSHARDGHPSYPSVYKRYKSWAEAARDAYALKLLRQQQRAA